jgi:hypothetical protein
MSTKRPTTNPVIADPKVRMVMPAKIVARLQPNSSRMGTDNTPVDHSGAELTKACRNTTPTMT